MSFGLSFVWSSPLYSSDKLSGSFNNEISSYSQTLGMMWRYIQAEIGLTMQRGLLEQWYYEGLGRDIKVLNEAGVIIFRGFVNSITVNIGGITATIGPMTEIGNRVLATYSARLILGDFIADAGQTETVFVEDLASQTKYGIWEKVIQAGTCIVNPATGYNEAEFSRDTYLAQYKSPQSTFTVTPNTDEAGSIILSIRGYQDWLTAYYYQPRLFGAVAPVTQTVTQKIIAALATNPNPAMLSGITNFIDVNPALKIDKENQYRTAYSVIEDAAKVGDGTNIWTFYINEDLIPVFEIVSTDIMYAYHLVDNRQDIFEYMTNNPINPYNVQAGKVVFLVDWLVGEYGAPGSIGDDPRLALINEVRYTAPNGLVISTVPLNRFESYVNFKAGGTY